MAHEITPMTLRAQKHKMTWGNPITAAATSVTIPISLPGNSYFVTMYAQVITAFAGVTSPTVTVGFDVDTDALVKSQPIDQTGKLIIGGSKLGRQLFCDKLNSPGSQPSFGTKGIYATFSSTAGNLSSLTAGEIEFVVIYAT